jgi:site-specific DNA-adenine methylase
MSRNAYNTIEKSEDLQNVRSNHHKSKMSMHTEVSRQERMSQNSAKSEVKRQTPLIGLSVNMNSLNDMLK